MTAINYSTAIFLINDDVRAMGCSYEEKPDTGKELKITLYKTMDKTLKKDDFVVVHTGTRHQMTVVKIVEEDVDLDIDSSEQVNWIIGRVDRADHEKLLALEEHAVKVLKGAEKRKRMLEARNSVFSDDEALKELELTNIKTLQITNGDQEKDAKQEVPEGGQKITGSDALR